MVDQARAARLAKRISAIVASAIGSGEIKDPRLAHVTITDARVSGDLHDATLFYTVMGGTIDAEPDYEGASAALIKATGHLRSLVGAGTGVRFTPTLAFFPFGAGPRKCIGEVFALMEATLLLATLARRFSPELIPGKVPDPEPVITLRPRGGLPMRMRRAAAAGAP